MKITKQQRREAKRLYRTCVVQGQLDEDRVRQAVQQLIAGRPRGTLGILDHLRRLVKHELARRTARVESAVPLSAEQQAAVEANLGRLYGAGLRIQFTPTPSLLGGLRVKIGSDVFDGSVQTRLATLRDSF